MTLFIDAHLHFVLIPVKWSALASALLQWLMCKYAWKLGKQHQLEISTQLLFDYVSM